MTTVAPQSKGVLSVDILLYYHATFARGDHDPVAFCCTPDKAVEMMAKKTPAKIKSLAEARSALRAAEAALEVSIEREERLKEAMDHRIAEFSHDVKNPLIAIISFSRLIRDDLLGPIDSDTFKEYVDVLHVSALRLLEFCQTNLDRARGKALDNEAEPREEEFEDVDMGRLVDEIQSLFSQQAQKRGIVLETKVTPNFPLIHAVPQHLYRVMTNLLSNAIKFTPRGGKVVIDAHLDESEEAVVLVIRDSGRGIPSHQILRIQKAYQSTVSPHGDKGTGLGLFIVNKLMHELGGDMAITSHEGTGTIVTLRFPRSMTRSISGSRWRGRS